MSWEYSMTDGEVDQLERQGSDVRELRAKRAARKQEILHARQNRPALQLGRLDAHMMTPRRADSQFFKDAAGKPPLLFGKKTWQERYENAPIVFGAVVQANEDLWDAGDGQNLPIVIALAIDPQHRTNARWVRSLAETIAEVKRGAAVPPDCERMIATLRDDQSMFCFRVGRSLAEGADAWCATVQIASQADLPHQALPLDGVLPFLLTHAPMEDRGLQVKLVPKQYYS